LRPVDSIISPSRTHYCSTNTSSEKHTHNTNSNGNKHNRNSWSTLLLLLNNNLKCPFFKRRFKVLCKYFNSSYKRLLVNVSIRFEWHSQSFISFVSVTSCSEIRIIVVSVWATFSECLNVKKFILFVGMNPNDIQLPIEILVIIFIPGPFAEITFRNVWLSIFWVKSDIIRISIHGKVELSKSFILTFEANGLFLLFVAVSILCEPFIICGFDLLVVFIQWSSCACWSCIIPPTNTST